MKIRLACTLAFLSSVLAGSAALAANTPDDLSRAFQAAFGRPPPLERDTEQPNLQEQPQGVAAETKHFRERLMPIRLIWRHGHHYALVVVESMLDVGHAVPGAISIAYVTRTSRGWISTGVSPGLASIGNFGEPADHTEVARFGHDPLFLSYSRYCGMGGCWTGISVFALRRTAPHYLGTLSGDGAWEALDVGEAEATGCDAYRTMSRVGPPRSRQDILSLSYFGWVKRTGHANGAEWFSGKTDAVMTAHGIAYVPPAKAPGINLGGIPGGGCD